MASVLAAATAIVGFTATPAMAAPPTAQDKLNQQIVQTCQKFGGTLTFALDGIHYECDPRKTGGTLSAHGTTDAEALTVIGQQCHGNIDITGWPLYYLCG